MHRSKAEVYFHLVWATWERQPLVTSDVERALYRCIEKEVQSLKCAVLAIGGMPDHVHLVVKAPTRVSPAQLAQRVKGVSSTFARNTLRAGEFFGWQDGYAVFSICPPHVSTVIAYVESQNRHHADNTIVSDWEETHEEIDDG